jgi:hypothetical protein
MRVVWLVAIAGVLVSGCAGIRKVFPGRSDLAARAGAEELKTERLAALMGGPRPIAPTLDGAQFLARTWVEYALLAEAFASNAPLTDSATVSQAMWPEIAQLRSSHWHDTLTHRRPPPSAATADSLYQRPELRVFQHILVSMPSNADAKRKATALGRARAILARLNKGEDFGALALEVSDDPGSRKDQGFLPPTLKGKFVPAFDSAAWQLDPGKQTGLVLTQFGYHVIRRPSIDEARPHLLSYLAEHSVRQADSIYMEDLGSRMKLTISSRAGTRVRSAMKEPESAGSSRAVLASFRGGELTTADFVRWLGALPPMYGTNLRQASDDYIGRFVRLIALNVLLLKQADSAHVEMTAEEWEGLRGRYVAAVDSLRSDMGFTGGAGEAPGPKLSAYIDQISGGRLRRRPLPSQLGALLRERGPYRYYPAGIHRSVEVAVTELMHRDSTSKRGLQPAPGPPPVPQPPATDTTHGKSGGHS